MKHANCTACQVAELILSGTSKRIAFLTGAGASVASGIPDFRSPGGMYDTLRPELLTATDEDRIMLGKEPTYVVDKALFYHNPLPYHEVRRPFIVGTGVMQWKPNICHLFYRLCEDKGLLKRLYTQNIDGLDFHVGLPNEKIVCVHGTIRRTMCEFCQTDPYKGDYAAYIGEVKQNIKDIYGVDPSAPKESTPILCRNCGKPGVKPATVLYGSSMPTEFFDSCERDFPQTKRDPSRSPDLLFVVGSSLTVYPAASVPSQMPKEGHRVLVNHDKAGDFTFGGANPRDFFLQGDIDAEMLRLIEHLGWLQEASQYKHLLCSESVDRLEKAVAGQAIAKQDDNL